MMFNLLVLTLSLMFTVSCSTRIGVRTPSTQFISPEAMGSQFQGEIDVFAALGAKANLNFDNDRTDNALDVNDKGSIPFGSILGLGATIGTIPKLDVLAVAPGNKHPALYGLKFQVLGSPRIGAEKGNHSLAIIGLIGGGTRGDSNDDDLELIAQDEEVQTALSTSATRAGLIYGYRFAKRSLFYTGATYSTMNFSGRLESENAALDGERIKYSSHSLGANAGFMFELKSLLTLKIEVSHQKINWQRTDPKSFNRVSVGTGWRWF